MTDDTMGDRRPAGPPSGAALAARLDLIRDATLGAVRRRGRAGLVARLAIGGGVAAMVLSAVLFVTASGFPRTADPAPFAGTAAPFVEAPTATAAPGTLCVGTGCYGVSGATAWYLDGSTLSVTVDGGASWQKRTLPAQLRTGFQQAAVDARGDVIAAAISSEFFIVGVVASGSDDWAVSEYAPELPATIAPSLMPPAFDPGSDESWRAPRGLTALVALSPDGARAVLVAQLTFLPGDTTHAVLASDDGGRSFSQRSAGTDAEWQQVTVDDSGTAYAVTYTGDYQLHIRVSDDDAATWGDPGPIDFQSDKTAAGTLALVGPPNDERQVVAATRTVDGRSGTLLYAVSKNAVMSLSGKLSDADAPAVAPIAKRYAAITTDEIRTTSGGDAWRSHKVRGLPKGWAPTQLGFSSDKRGLVILSKGTAYRVFSTLDGGSTWSQIAGASQHEQPSDDVRYVKPVSTVSDPASIAKTIFSNTALPPGAKALASSPDQRLDSAPTATACTPFHDAARWWSVPGMSEQDLFDWMQKNSKVDNGWGLGSSQNPTLGETRWETGTWAASTFSELLEPPAVIFTMIADGSGSDIRIDVQSIPKDASCNSTGVAHSVPTPTP